MACLLQQPEIGGQRVKRRTGLINAEVWLDYQKQRIGNKWQERRYTGKGGPPATWENESEECHVGTGKEGMIWTEPRREGSSTTVGIFLPPEVFLYGSHLNSLVVTYDDKLLEGGSPD